jgi:hypothetical protein
MRQRSQTLPSPQGFGEDDRPTRPDAGPLPLFRGLTVASARDNEPEEDEDEEEFDDLEDLDDPGAVRETRAGALATSAWDRGQGSSAFDAELSVIDEDALADTERHPMFFDIEATTDVDIQLFEDPEDRG